MHHRVKKSYLLLLFIIATIYSVPCLSQSRLQQFDDRVLINLADNRTPEKTGFFMFLSNTNHYGAVGVPAGLLVGGLLGHDQQMRENSLYVASSTAITFGLNALIKIIVKRPRPFIQNIHIVPVYRAGSYSFPSGHTSTCFSTATALSIAYPKWYVIAPSFLWAGAVGYSRMYLGVHYPTDVGAGAILGTGAAASMSFLRK